MENREQEYKVIDKERMANEALIEKLKSIKEYISNDMPEWLQLIAVGGFVVDIVRLLKWDDHKRVYNPWHYSEPSNKMNMMTKDEIIEEIWTAIDYHINEPYAEELNTIWHNWNTDTKYMPNEKTTDDISDVIINIMETHHPGFLEAAEKYFRLSEMDE